MARRFAPQAFTRFVLMLAPSASAREWDVLLAKLSAVVDAQLAALVAGEEALQCNPALWHPDAHHAQHDHHAHADRHRHQHSQQQQHQQQQEQAAAGVDPNQSMPPHESHENQQQQHPSSSSKPAASPLPSTPQASLSKPSSSNEVTTAAVNGMQAPDARLLRTQCRMLVLLQRSLDHIHSQCMVHMPWAPQSALLNILKRTVDTAAACNARSAAEAAATAAEPADGTAMPYINGIPQQQQQLQQAASLGLSADGSVESSEPPASPLPSSAAKEAPGEPVTPVSTHQKMPEISAASTPATPAPSSTSPGNNNNRSAYRGSSASGGIRRGDAASRRITTEPMPELMTSSPATREPLHPAFMRLESEGGMLLVQCLLRVIGAKPGATGGLQDPAALQAVQQRLLAYCEEVIAVAAARCGGGDGTEGAAAPTLPRWDDAVRAALVVRALEVDHGMVRTSAAQKLQGLLPHVSQLMYCPQPMIRQALYRFMASQEIVQLVQSKGEAASAAV